MDTKQTPHTLGTITLLIQGAQLVGYILEDGTLQFLIRGTMRTFANVLQVWDAWTDTN